MNLTQNIITGDNKSVRDVFRIQDDLLVKISFVTEDNKLVGVISDGDIRRYILGGGDLDRQAISIINRKPVISRSVSEAISILRKHKNLKAIPILDKNNALIDIYCEEVIEHKSIKVPVVINAGGRGVRLDPYTRILPKPLIPVGDTPMIELIMREFIKYDCCEFSVIVNYKGQMMKAYFSESTENYSINWIDEKKPLGTGGGLGLVDGINETFFFVNCDTLVHTDYPCILDHHRREKNLVTVVCAYKNIRLPYGVMDTAEGGQVVEIKEKPEISFLTNVGMYLVEPEVIQRIGKNNETAFTSLLGRLIDEGMKIGVYPISEMEWIDMGQTDEIKRANRILERKGKNT